METVVKEEELILDTDTSNVLGDIMEKNIDNTPFTFVCNQPPMVSALPSANCAQGQEPLDQCNTSLFAREMLMMGNGASVSCVSSAGTDNECCVNPSVSCVSSAGTDNECCVNPADPNQLPSLQQMKHQIHEENSRLMESMSPEEIQKERELLMAKMDPKLIELLQRRKLEQKPKNVKKKQTESTEPLENMDSGSALKANSSSSPSVTTGRALGTGPRAAVQLVLDEAIAALELLDTDTEGVPLSQAPRVAVDPRHVQSALSAQTLGATRRHVAIARLFHVLQVECSLSTGESVSQARANSHQTEYTTEQLCALAAFNLCHVRPLYFAMVDQSDSKQMPTRDKWLLHEDIQPESESAWFLRPLLRVYEAHKNKQVLGAEAIDDCVLCLLFTYVLFAQRPSYFTTCSDTIDLWAKLSVVFLLGPDFYNDVLVHRLLECLLHDCLVPAVVKQKQSLFSVDHVVDTLCTVQTLMTRMMDEFECSSFGDCVFSQYLLLPVLNAHSSVAVMFWCWQRANMLKACTLTPKQCMIPVSWIEERSRVQVLEQSELVLCYAACISGGALTLHRHPVLYTICIDCMQHFVGARVTHTQYEQVVAIVQRVLHKAAPLHRS